jgi:hypothetical protein
LGNWALWLARGSSSHSPGVSTIYRSNGYRFDFSNRTPPPLIGDASDVDSLVLQLSDTHRQALKAHYLWTGPMALRAKTLGCHPSTLTNRVRAATFALDDLDQARRKRTPPAQNRAGGAQTVADGAT